jgi:Leucine-rich repeat (LRR) protein
MKKRELLRKYLRWLLLGEHEEPAPAEPVAEEPPQPKQPQPSAMPTSEADPVQPALALSTDQFPPIEDEIRGLLASPAWEEVNQGLELLVSSLGSDAIKPLAALIDASGLCVKHPDLWQKLMGISLIHEINAVAKLAELTGELAEVHSIHLNRASFADEIQIDLTLLSSAASLEQLIINGGSITGLTGLGDLRSLRHLALLGDGVDWEPEEQEEIFCGLTKLQSLSLNAWPWDDLRPLESLSQLERLDLRGGELSTLQGIDVLGALTHLSLRDFYSLSEAAEIGSLSKLISLQLLNLGVSSLKGLEGLTDLNSIELELSNLVDVTALASMPNLTTVRLECDDLVGLGSLTAAGILGQLKLSNIPNYSYGENKGQSLGRDEMDRLCRSWKAVQTRGNKVSSVAAEGSDLAIVLLGVCVLETLAGQIDTAELSDRVDQLVNRWGTELRSRAYWPRCGAAECYSKTVPIGQWLDRAAGSISPDTLEEIAATLAKHLPATPQRA